MLKNYKEALNDFERCAEVAPERTYQEAKDLAQEMGDIIDDVINRVRSLGLQADNCDLVRKLHVALYQYVKDSNPGHTMFPTAEGFGEHVDGPAGPRIIEQTTSMRNFLENLASNPLDILNTVDVDFCRII